MDKTEFEKHWSESLRSSEPSVEQFDRLAQAVVDLYRSGDATFRQHIKNRFRRVTKTTGQNFDPDNFDLDMARAFIADEIGFRSWDELIRSIQNPAENRYSILFRYAIAVLWRGDYTGLKRAVGGPEIFDGQIIEWLEAGYFADEPETMAEAFAAACMLGRDRAAAALLDNGVDPYAGMRSGLSGFHYAVSGGWRNVVELLIARDVPMEIKNTYGGTVLGQALWSAINEHMESHAAIIESLIEAGAKIEPGTLDWWEVQSVPSTETKSRVTNALLKAKDKSAP